jgi:hypothetical protein
MGRAEISSISKMSACHHSCAVHLHDRHPQSYCNPIKEWMCLELRDGMMWCRRRKDTLGKSERNIRRRCLAASVGFHRLNDNSRMACGFFIKGRRLEQFLQVLWFTGSSLLHRFEDGDWRNLSACSSFKPLGNRKSSTNLKALQSRTFGRGYQLIGSVILQWIRHANP